MNKDREEALLAFQQGVRERWGSFEDGFYEKLLKLTGFFGRGWSWVSQRNALVQYGTVVVGLAAALLVGRLLFYNQPVQSPLLLFLPAVLLSTTYGGLTAGTITSLVGAFLAYLVWPPSEQTQYIGANGVIYQSMPIVPYLLYFFCCIMVMGLWKLQERRQGEVVRLKEGLEERVTERTAELQAANDELSNFCYSISHDLRSPMRNIVASSSLLSNELEGKLEDHNQELVRGIGRSASRLSELVDDLLNHARLGHAAMKPRWVNFTGIADEIGHQLRQEEWPCKTVEFKVQPNMVATVDPVLFKLALHNLLENACKYSRADSDLVIEIKEMRTRTGAIFAIKDNGIGFDMQYASKIFEPFQRLHRDSDYPGTGIGLANVKRIIERHEGRIWVESKPGVGTTFFFTIGELKKNRVELPETESI